MALFHGVRTRKVNMPTSNVFSGEALRAVAMPLGGLGTGTIALAGDGSLRQWQIANQVNHAACVPHSFFAVWARQGPKPVARVLQSAALYDHEGPTPPPTSSDHLVPPAHRHLLARLPGVASTEFIGSYPIAEISYSDKALPLEVTLEAFSPFIPLEADDSALPLIVFNFTVSNPTDRRVSASLAAALQNAVGWDGLAPITGRRVGHAGPEGRRRDADGGPRAHARLGHRADAPPEAAREGEVRQRGARRPAGRVRLARGRRRLRHHAR